MQKKDDLSLSEIVTVKLCHDLAGPLGAINNGMELFQDSDSSLHLESVNLVSMSAKEAVYKLLYYRQAYGTVNAEGESNIESFKKLVEDFFATSKVKIEWDIPATSSTAALTISNIALKIALNAILVVTGAMILGGTLKIKINKYFDKFQIYLKGFSEMIKIAPEIIAILSASEPAKPTVKEINAYLAVKLAHLQGNKITISHDNNNIALSVLK